jgi:DNA-binding NarL/FixJ family response regulator
LATVGLAAGGLTIVRNESQWQDALQRERPQLVILEDDIAPGNGPTLLRALRLRHPQVLTVYVAKQHSAELERTVRQLGVLYYTAAPPDWETLDRVLSSVLLPQASQPQDSAL